MKELLRLSLALGFSGVFAAQAGTLFSDNFSVQGTQLNTANWTTDPGFDIGRTQLTDWITPGAGGQFVVGASGAQLTVDTYNASDTSRFLGTQAETLQTFQPTADSSVSFTTVLQLQSLQPGLVYSMYLYGANEDEIDIELPTNLLQSGSTPQVELNRFLDGSPDAGYGGLYALPAGFNPLVANSYTIQWSLNQISYLVDGTLLATVYTDIPQSALAVNLLAFAPNSNWGAAYSDSLQPVTSGPGIAYTGLVSSVDVEEYTPEPSTVILISGALLCLYLLRELRIRRV